MLKYFHSSYFAKHKILSIIVINSAGITDGFSMCGGEFVDLYKDVRQKGIKSLKFSSP